MPHHRIGLLGEWRANQHTNEWWHIVLFLAIHWLDIAVRQSQIFKKKFLPKKAVIQRVSLNKSVERQKDVLARVVKGLWKKCVITKWVMSTFLQSQGAARDDAVFGDPTDEFRVSYLGGAKAQLGC